MADTSNTTETKRKDSTVNTDKELEDTVKKLVARIHRVSDEIYESSYPEFDCVYYEYLLEELKKIAPNHPLLKED